VLLEGVFANQGLNRRLTYTVRVNLTRDDGTGPNCLPSMSSEHCSAPL